MEEYYYRMCRIEIDTENKKVKIWYAGQVARTFELTENKKELRQQVIEFCDNLCKI